MHNVNNVQNPVLVITILVLVQMSTIRVSTIVTDYKRIYHSAEIDVTEQTFAVNLFKKKNRHLQLKKIQSIEVKQKNVKFY